MKRIDEAQLAAWTDERKKKDSRRLQPAFWGTVSEVKGSAGTRQVQVIRTGKSASDGQWHFVQVNGQVPQQGDVVQLQWQDENVAVVTSILNTPRVVDQHNYKMRVYWTGAYTAFAGYNFIGYNNVSYDPSSMFGGGGIIHAQLSGYYLATAKAGLSGQGTWGALAFYVNANLYSQGTYLAGATDWEGVASDIIHLTKGDQINVYVYSNTGGQALQPGSSFEYFALHLLSAD